MELKDLPYFVKFIFSCENDECISTTDSEMLKYVIDKNTGEEIRSLYIGQNLNFEPIKENDKTYEIIDIKIRHLFHNTDYHNKGIDLQDCQYPQGEIKEWLFSILVSTKVI
ncbi:hypothetical protein [Elizabethkingia anophelis]|uniref:hypothetical protein n=1 Tax=Elizabethkingia anophelis TaxID=1117645 RepID=UPI0009952FA4|nr:hypothetical protein [Elizabethkingia anophelis]AQW92982.1 hypothetical protein BBD30_01655 [Elizabethkingia anophelis]OPB61042.1 hypothetical protein BAS07_01085 [Elizabethkingia anophelis]